MQASVSIPARAVGRAVGEESFGADLDADLGEEWMTSAGDLSV